MSTLAFDENVKRQIRRVIDYANQNVYKVDDILDMMNGQMDAPGAKPEHLVLVPIGRWICYYLVDHPEYGRCHYFLFKPDASGKLPDKPTMEYALNEFGIERTLLDTHITVDEAVQVSKIILPLRP